MLNDNVVIFPLMEIGTKKEDVIECLKLLEDVLAHTIESLELSTVDNYPYQISNSSWMISIGTIV